MGKINTRRLYRKGRYLVDGVGGGGQIECQTPSAAAANWIANTAYAMFTATGVVRIKKIVAECDVSLGEVGAGATTDMTIRGSVGDRVLLGECICDNFNANDLMAGRDGQPTTLPNYAVEESESVVISDCNIEAFFSNDADITAGQFTIFIDWEPVSDGATLVTATWA